MSYPRKLQILIIEDDREVREGYRKLLHELQTDFPHSPPTMAVSLAAAREALAQPRPYHVVILDLNLPLESRESAVEGTNPGEQLIDLLAARDDYPVPVLLVVSGKLGLLEIGPLSDRLRRDFWHGEPVFKGPGQNKAIRRGLENALRYCDVGVHVQDGGRRFLLPLSPREDDLLRRCVLAHDGFLGVDLEWWAAEEGPTVSHPRPNAGPTKVLMGSFLIDEGVGLSSPRFFKFEPSGNAPYTARGSAFLPKNCLTLPADIPGYPETGASS
jgi:CheY-like chemotaxis protein